MLRKATAFLRHSFVRVWLRNRFLAKQYGFVGPHCSIFVVGQHSRIKHGRNLVLARFCELQSRGELQIGDNFFANDFVRVIAVQRICIGDNCLLAPYVSLLDHDHSAVDRTEFVSDPIVIGNNVWIGEKATILKGVVIGDNTIVGAGAVVSKSMPADSIVAGNPARAIRKAGSK